MNSTIEQRAAKNTFVGIISFVVSLFQSILLVPLILNSWGTIKYGNWIALLAGFTLLQTLDLGHQNYIGNEINILYHKSKSELKKKLSASLLIAWLIGFLELLIVVILISSGNLTDFLGLETESYNLDYALLWLTIMWFIFGSISGILIRLLVPIGKLYEQQWISIIIRLIQFLGLLVIVIIEGSILTAAIVYSIIQSILTIITLIYIKNIIPEFYPWWQNGNFKIALNNFFKSLVLTVNSVIHQLSVNGLVLFVSNFYQAAQVPVFTTIRTLTNTATGVTNIIVASINPDIVKYYSRGENRKLFLSLTTNLFLSGLIINIALIFSLFFIEPIYNIWTNRHLSFNRSLFLFLAAGASINNYGIGLISYFTSVNKLRQITIITVSKNAILFLVCYLLVFKEELSIVGISVVFSELVSSILFPIYLMQKEKEDFFKEKRFKFFIMSLIPPLTIICLAILDYFNFYSSYFIVITLLVVAVVYYLNWNLIDAEVKERLITTARKYLKTK